MYKYAVLGAGRQGQAIAYDLAINGNAQKIILFDKDINIALRAAKRLNKLIESNIIYADELDVNSKFCFKCGSLID